MPCLFGEINEPSSRAFWDGFDDEDEAIAEVPSLQWDYSSSTEQSPLSIDLLLLLEGHNIARFGEQIITDSTVLCRIPSKGVSLHKISGKSQVVGLLEEDLSSSGQVASLLMPYSNIATNVVTLTVQPKVEYKSEDMAAVKDEITFLRAVNHGAESVPQLEVPNFIAGIGAGVASYRVIKSMPVNSYIAYTDRSDLDTLSAEPILKLLRDIGITCPNKYTPKFKDESHLYM